MVVSDTSALTNLIKLGKHELLNQLFMSISIPEAVYDELSFLESHKQIVDAASWISVHAVSNQQLVRELKRYLDDGESEAIALAVELKPDYILIDEKAGRKKAEEYGLKKIGLIGVAILAKQQNLIPSVKQLLDDLIGKADFFISQALYEEVLFQLNE